MVQLYIIGSIRKGNIPHTIVAARYIFLWTRNGYSGVSCHSSKPFELQGPAPFLELPNQLCSHDLFLTTELPYIVNLTGLLTRPAISRTNTSGSIVGIPPWFLKEDKIGILCFLAQSCPPDEVQIIRRDSPCVKKRPVIRLAVEWKVQDGQHLTHALLAQDNFPCFIRDGCEGWTKCSMILLPTVADQNRICIRKGS